MKLYYIKFSELKRKQRPGETPALIWAIIAESDDAALAIADPIGLTPEITSSHQLSKYWK